MKYLKWEEAQKIIKEKGKYLLEFYTTWCGDCKMMQPIVEEAIMQIHEFDKDVQVLFVDADEADVFKKRGDFKVYNVPSFYKIIDGEATHIGYEYLSIDKLVNSFK